MMLCAMAVFAGLVGVSLLRSVGLATVSPGPVINPEEWAILSSEVKGGKEDAITQYIRLRSLSGFTGGFLTLFFALMYAYSRDEPLWISPNLRSAPLSGPSCRNRSASGKLPAAW
jgi:hypothetical protein